MRQRRLGRFSVGMAFVDSFDTTLKRIMGLCIIVRAEVRYETNAIEYVAISEHFEPVALGCVVPEYRWVCDDGLLRAELID